MNQASPPSAVLKSRTIVALSIGSILVAMFLASQAFRQQMIYERTCERIAAVFPTCADGLGEIVWARNLYALFALVFACIPGFLIWRNKRLAAGLAPSLMAAPFGAELRKHKKALVIGAVAIAACALLIREIGSGTRRHGLISEAENALKSAAFDPDAMQFRNEAIDATSFPEIVVCGEVNGKNRSGGYIGYQPFVFNGPRSGAAVLTDRSDYEGWCAKAR